ncbi:hypothetical protein GF385_03660 [Candidatus Dependentiae bacterium]|nr:hypothetical protein [Candidatus Dependentiae bacterium]
MKTLKAILCLFFFSFITTICMQNKNLIDLTEKSEDEKDLEKIFTKIHPDLSGIYFNKKEITPEEKEKIKERLRILKLKELKEKLKK